jgi:hypothetical protein
MHVRLEVKSRTQTDQKLHCPRVLRKARNRNESGRAVSFDRETD